MPPRRIRIRIPQHSRQLGNTILAVNDFHVAGRDSLPSLLRYDEMSGGAGRDLGEMSDHQHLASFGNLG